MFLCGLPSILPADDTKTSLPDGPGKETTARLCSACHGIEVATGHRDSREGWNAVIGDMIQRGAQGSDDEFGQVVDYLAAHFPKPAPGSKVFVNTASAKELVERLSISDKEAAAMVSYRDEKGKFKSFDDLIKVPGLDLSKLEAKKDLLVYIDVR